MLKPSITTGLVIAGAYATKLRRTLFAQTKHYVSAGQLTQEEIARASGELNSILYNLLVERLSLSKGDVVRIRIEYLVEDGRISWDLSSLKVEAFKRVPDEEVASALSEVLGSGE